MNTVAIAGLNRVNNPKSNKGGSTVLGFFDCEARGFGLQGCAPVRTPRHGLAAWPPKVDGQDSSRQSIMLEHNSLRHTLMINAREAYRALGGNDAEWIGKTIPMGPHTGEEVEGEARKVLQLFMTPY